MRNPCPLKRYLLVAYHIGAVVETVQRAVLFTQRVRRQRLSALDHPAHLKLKLREHRLAVDRALELVEEVVDEIRALFFVPGLSQKMAHEQNLVAGGGDLRDEDHIVACADGLRLLAVIAVQGVAHLVGDGEHGVERVLVVQKHIGVRAGIAGGVCAAALAAVFVHVYPAAVKALSEKRGIVLAQHLERVEHGFLCVFEAYLRRRVGYNGGVYVVHMKLVNAQKLFAHGDIAVHLVHVGVNGVDEIHVHALRNLCPVERGGQRGGVLPRLGEEPELSKLRVKGGGKGVFELVETRIIGCKGVPSQLPVPAFKQGDEGRGGQRVRIALAVGYVWEREVRVSENAADIVRRVRHFTGGSEQPFLGGRENVRGTAPDALNGAAVSFKLAALIEKAVEHRVGNGEYLRCRER